MKWHDLCDLETGIDEIAQPRTFVSVEMDLENEIGPETSIVEREWIDTQDMADDSFSWDDIDDAIDNGTIADFYQEDQMDKEYMVAKNIARGRLVEQAKATYKANRDNIFACANHKQLDKILDALSDVELNPDLDFGYNGLLWAVEKRSTQIDQEQKLRAKIEQDRKFAAILERARLIEAGKIKPTDETEKTEEAKPRKEVVPIVETSLPVIMQLRGTHTLKRVEEAYVFRALLKQGYEVYNVKA